MRRLLSIGLAAALLAGCATAGSRQFCPSLAEYDAELQRRAAEEMDKLPRDSATGRLIEDYGDLRARIRAACS